MLTKPPPSRDIGGTRGVGRTKGGSRGVGECEAPPFRQVSPENVVVLLDLCSEQYSTDSGREEGQNLMDVSAGVHSEGNCLSTIIRYGNGLALVLGLVCGLPCRHGDGRKHCLVHTRRAIIGGIGYVALAQLGDSVGHSARTDFSEGDSK